MKTFFQAERYDEQRDMILSAFADNNGRMGWHELRALGITNSVLHEHLSQLERRGKVSREDREQNGQIVSVFYLRQRHG